MKDRRVLIPIVAGVVLAVVCVWRVMTNKSQDYAAQVAAATVMRSAAPLDFEALDADNHLVRLSAFLGRHRIVVIFFDGERGADRDAELLRLRERFDELKSRDVKVIAVGSAIPQQNRAARDRVGGFPFPLVSDFDPTSPEGTLRIHRRWGRLGPVASKPLTGVFVIDRKAQVAYTGDAPRPMESVDQAVDGLVK